MNDVANHQEHEVDETRDTDAAVSEGLEGDVVSSDFWPVDSVECEAVASDDAEDAPVEEPHFLFVPPAVLTQNEQRQVILRRIKKHERLMVEDQITAFELKVQGASNETVVQRVAARAELIRRLVEQHNIVYGGQ